MTWLDIGGFEDRLEAHIDALVLGGETAPEVCKERAVVGDFGELHTTVRVLFRQKKDGSGPVCIGYLG